MRNRVREIRMIGVHRVFHVFSPSVDCLIERSDEVVGQDEIDIGAEDFHSAFSYVS